MIHIKYMILSGGLVGFPLRLLTIGMLQFVFAVYAITHKQQTQYAKTTFEDYSENVKKSVRLLEFVDFSNNREKYNKMRDLMSAVDANGPQNQRGRPYQT